VKLFFSVPVFSYKIKLISIKFCIIITTKFLCFKLAIKKEKKSTQRTGGECPSMWAAEFGGPMWRVFRQWAGEHI